MILRFLVIAALMFPTSGCGTKSELQLPSGKPPPRDQKDASQPPNPISR